MTGVFYFHPNNTLATKLKEVYHEQNPSEKSSKGFLYATRAELDFKLQRLVSDAKFDMWPTFHTTVGPLGGPGDIVTRIEFDEGDKLDQYAAKLCNRLMNWAFIKIHNGPMRSVVGYCTASVSTPYNMGAAEMAQKGIISATFVPRPV